MYSERKTSRVTSTLNTQLNHLNFIHHTPKCLPVAAGIFMFVETHFLSSDLRPGDILLFITFLITDMILAMIIERMITTIGVGVTYGSRKPIGK